MPSLCDALLKRPSARRAAVLRARPGAVGNSESYLLYDSHTSIDTIHGNSRLVTSTSIVTKRGKRRQRGSQHQEPSARSSSICRYRWLRVHCMTCMHAE